MKKLFIPIFIILFTACEKTEPMDCDDSSVTYTNNVKAIISQSCATTGCHVAGTGREVFDTYDDLKIQVDNGSIKDLVIVKKTMPSGFSLSDCDYSLVKAWLDQGAKE